MYAPPGIHCSIMGPTEAPVIKPSGQLSWAGCTISIQPSRGADPFAAFHHGEPAVLLEGVVKPLCREYRPHQRRGPAGEAGAQRAVGKRRVLDMILDVVEKLLREVVILDARQRQTSEC